MRLPTLILALFFAVTAAAGSSLDDAIEAYWNADFDTAENTLREIVVDDLSHDQRLELFKYRAMLSVARNREAVDDFLAALDVDPAFRIDPAAVAPPVAKQFEKAQFLTLKRSFEQGRKLYLDGRYREAAPFFDVVLQVDPLNMYAKSFLELTRQRAGEESR